MFNKKERAPHFCTNTTQRRAFAFYAARASDLRLTCGVPALPWGGRPFPSKTSRNFRAFAQHSQLPVEETESQKVTQPEVVGVI